VLNSAIGFDPTIVGNSSRSLSDINIGSWVYSDNFFAGATAIQVFSQKLYDTEAIGKSLRHFMIIAGYKVPIGDDLTFISSFAIRAVSPAPISYDINAKIRYQNIGWVGVSYRRSDAIAVMAGAIISETFDLSYSYDAITSNIRNYSTGSHEIIIGYRLRPKGKVAYPSNFW
jgi:type IX secretion system PorP/SprF family membrane protein